MRTYGHIEPRPAHWLTHPCSVTKSNASLVRECSASNKRILEADHRVIIVGGGPAGLSAAVYAARANMLPLVVARDGGQLESTSMVDNYPGFKDGVDAIDLILALTGQVLPICLNSLR